MVAVGGAGLLVGVGATVAVGGAGVSVAIGGTVAVADEAPVAVGERVAVGGAAVFVAVGETVVVGDVGMLVAVGETEVVGGAGLLVGDAVGVPVGVQPCAASIASAARTISAANRKEVSTLFCRRVLHATSEVTSAGCLVL